MSDVTNATDPTRVPAASVSDSGESVIQMSVGALSVSDSPESGTQGDMQGGAQESGPLSRAQIHVGEPEGEPLLTRWIWWLAIFLA